MIGLLMTAHQAGGILAALLGLWLVEPFGWRSAFWVGPAPLVIAVPLVAMYLPESLGFLLARDRTDDARRLADRFGAARVAAVWAASAPSSGPGSAGGSSVHHWLTSPSSADVSAPGRRRPLPCHAAQRGHRNASCPSKVRPLASGHADDALHG